MRMQCLVHLRQERYELILPAAIADIYLAVEKLPEPFFLNCRGLRDQSVLNVRLGLTYENRP